MLSRRIVHGSWLVCLPAALAISACGSSSRTSFEETSENATEPTGALADGGASSSAGPVDRNAACAQSVVPTALLPGAVLLVIDKSFSMTSQPNGNDSKLPGDSKWEIAKPILVDLVNDLPGGLELGLELFPSTLGCTTSAPQVPLSDITMTRSVVASRINMTSPAGDTPTADALGRAYDDLLARTGVGARAVIFMSDGIPNCGSSTASVKAAVGGARTKNGIKTYVIGIPGSPSSDFSELAVAGETRRSATCKTSCGSDSSSCCHYATSSAGFAKDLKAAIGEIAAKLRTDCVYAVPSPPPGQPSDPGLVNVLASVDGKNDAVVPQSSDPTADGWSYTDTSNKTIEIHGKLCADILASKASKVEILVGCPTIVK